MARSAFDRSIFICTWLALAAAVTSGVLFLAADTARSEVGLGLGLAFMVVFFFVSAPLHVAVIAMSVVRGFTHGPRPMAWVYAYLVVTLAAHAVAGETLGAFDSLKQDLIAWNREREQPAQVSLEQALRPPGDVEAARAALAAGADPDAINPQNPWNLLVLAASQAHVELVDALLQAGADPDRRSLYDTGLMGVSLGKPAPVEVAAFSEKAQRLATVARLLDAGADVTTSHIRLGACYRGDLALLDLAISAGAPDLADRKGNGCLHMAASRGHVEMVERLLRDGASPDARNLANNTPLDSAISRRQYAAALALAQAGARTRDEGRLEQLLNRSEEDPDLMALQAWLRDGRR